MNKKNNKRSLGLSLLCLLLCAAMLVGSTFAWFTDNASTSVNTIQAGTLDIDLVDASGNTLVGKSLDFVKANDADEQILWEPGVTYNLEKIYVQNKGNLAVKYMVEITGIEGSAKLNEAIEWTIDYGFGAGATEGHLAAGTTSAAITISGHMKEEAGNEYQGEKITGVTIMVRATQDTVEYDSINNTYDADAEYDMSEQPTTPSVPGEGEGGEGGDDSSDLPFDLDKENKEITVYNASDFAMLAKGAAEFGLTVNDYPDQYTVKLGKSINYGGGTLSQPIEAWWNKLDGQGNTISNVKVNTTEKWAGLFKPGAAENTLNIKNLKLDNITVTTTAAEAFAGVVVGYSANAHLEDITVTNSTVNGTKYSGGIIGQAGSTHVIGCSVSGTSVTGTRVGGIVGDAFNEGGTASVKNCSVDNITLVNNDFAGGTSGSIAGRLRNGITADNCTDANVVGADQQVGGKPTQARISTAAALKDIAANPENYKGKTIVLTADIDLADEAWTPIDAWNVNLDGTVIDGQGHSIKNMKVTGVKNPGFIGGNASSVTIKNLIFENAYVKDAGGSSNYSGVVIGYNYAGITMTNVHVKNSQVHSNWQCGGLVGINSEHPMTFVNCSITDSFVGGYNATAGAIYGMGSVDVNLTDCSAKNVDLYTDGMTWDSTQKQGGVYLLVGHTYGKTATLTNCSVENVNVVDEVPAN